MIRTDRLFLRVSFEALQLAECYQFVVDASCGAVDIFVGTVRNHAEGRSVERLEYQGYPEMGEQILEKISQEAFRKWALGKIAVHHRLGVLELTDPSVVIAVSAPHREEAFAASRFILEALKKDLPVWKKEHFTGGEKSWKGSP